MRDRFACVLRQFSNFLPNCFHLGGNDFCFAGLHPSVLLASKADRRYQPRSGQFMHACRKDTNVRAYFYPAMRPLWIWEKTMLILFPMPAPKPTSTIATRKSRIAYSTALAPFCFFRFASDAGSVVSLFSIVSRVFSIASSGIRMYLIGSIRAVMCDVNLFFMSRVATFHRGR